MGGNYTNPDTHNNYLLYQCCMGNGCGLYCCCLGYQCCLNPNHQMLPSLDLLGCKVYVCCENNLGLLGCGHLGLISFVICPQRLLCVDCEEIDRERKARI
jgi:hypothetical protein